jgi:hypothetical protein
MGLSRVHGEVLILEPGTDKLFEVFLQFIEVEATLIVVIWNTAREQIVDIEYLLGKLGVCCDTFIDRLF